MKLYTKKILSLILLGTISLNTMACNTISDVNEVEISDEKDSDKLDNENTNKRISIDETRAEIATLKTNDEETIDEEKEDIDYIQKPAVRAIKNANIRLSNDKNSELKGVLPKGELLETIGIQDDWYQVIYNDEICYINSVNVIEDVITTTDEKFSKIVYLKENTDMYDNEQDENIIKQLDQYESAEVFYETDEYYYVISDNNIGFIKKECTEELTDTYVIVDISSQTLNLYENNELILTTPVVTGKENKNDTKVGIHTVYDTRGHRDLIGTNGTRSYVDVMMKFYHGQGLHDAEYHTDYDEFGNVVKKHGWRDISEFGGYTFINNGSHGCINVPHDAAIEVNDHINKDDKVLIKR